jgi:spore coat protein A
VQPSGACCKPLASAACESVTEAACTAQGGAFRGALSSCSPNPCSVVLTPFVDPLPRLRPAVPTSGTAGGSAQYRLAMVELTQKLHSDLPATRVWGVTDGAGGGTFPGPTIEATAHTPIDVTWANDLRDENGALRAAHLLTSDACLHGGAAGPPRTVMHLHGGHVPAAFDGAPELTLVPGAQTTYRYPNRQNAATLWYHDHALGITRLNVYLGLAGFYIVRSPEEDVLGLPSGEFDVPLVVQDRTFRADGSLSYPFRWVEDFFGDTILVNGKVWPTLDVKRGKYRFRVLNGSNGRTYTLALSNGASFQQIASDGGLLAAPVALDRLTVAPGERAEIVVDFAGYEPGTDILLKNSAPAPFPGSPGVGVVPNVMKLHVVPEPGHMAPIRATLAAIQPLLPEQSVIERELVLAKGPDPCTGSRWTINGRDWDDIVEMPRLGTTEIWRFVNTSGHAHPMHLHLVQFQVLDRQAQGAEPLPPPPNEAGWKDTVVVMPRETVRVIARFDHYAGNFPYHCHSLEHEDHMMMRQFRTTTTCGDGVIGEPEETCDPPGSCPKSCDDNDPCTADRLVGSAEACTARCEHVAAPGCGDGGAADGGPAGDAGRSPDAGAGGAADEDGGCSCRDAGTSSRGGAGALATLAVVGLARRRRRHARLPG